MIIKVEVGRRRRETNPTPYRKYTDTEAYESIAVSVNSRLLARFMALPVTRNLVPAVSTTTIHTYTYIHTYTIHTYIIIYIAQLHVYSKYILATV